MSYSRLILKDGADVVWGLDDLKSETASLSNPTTFLDNSASYYTASINASATNLIQTPIIFGGQTSLELISSINPCISIPALNLFSELYSKNNYSIEFWFKINKIPENEITILKKRNSTNIGLFLRDNYLIYRYGNSSSFIETSYGLAELDEPTHVVMNYYKDNIELIINGVSSSKLEGVFETTDPDINHSINNYIDFYGSSAISIIIDSIAIYPNTLQSNVCKRHYVYGLGKYVDESIFTNMGGLYFNIANDRTQKSYYQYWDTQDKWNELSYNNLILTSEGIRPVFYQLPTLGTLDNNITKVSNQIRFSSTASTTGTYIDINNFSSIFNEDNNTFFAKFKLDGVPPVSGSYQTLISLGINPLKEVLNFNLRNISGSYYLQAYHVSTASTVSFYVESITSSPTVYLGMKFDNQTTVYYAASSGNIQSGSFTTYSGSAYGVDILSSYMPLQDNSALRIGSRYSFNTMITASSDANQFLGTFNSLLFVDNRFTGSAYASIDSFNQYTYKTYFDTNDNRFKIGSFGTASFIIAGSKLTNTDFSGSANINSNRFEFGYPESVSGSQVQIFISMYDYNGNVVRAKEKIQKINQFEWLNLTNIYDKYIRFDIEMLSKDISYYPPIIKYFKGETYSNSSSYVDILGYTRSYIRIKNGASAQAYIPEIIQTPSVFLTDTSGIRSNKNDIDINFARTKIGTLGFFIRSNISPTSTKIFDIYSSSAAVTKLFSASIQSNSITVSSAIGTAIVNGGRSSIVNNKQWTHVSFVFDPKLEINTSSAFLIRFGDSNNSDFNIQNIYVLDTLLESKDIAYIHNGFVGGSAVVSVTSAASAIKIIDRDESRHSGVSASIQSVTDKQQTNVIFQPQLVQKRFLGEIAAATSLDSSSISNVLDFDGVDFFDSPPPVEIRKVLILSNNNLYSIDVTNNVLTGTIISTSDGDYVRVVDGVINKYKIFVKVNGSFIEYPELLKINAFGPQIS